LNIREGFEGGLYSLEEAKIRIVGYRAVVIKAEAEVKGSGRKQTNMIQHT